MEATPGLRIMVVAQDSIRYDGCHGHLGDAQETPVQRHHVYDLASITKVASTTLLTMMSEERGMLSLDQPLAELVPKSENVPLQVELGRRTIKDLLAHRSGLPAWIPFYLDLIAYHDTTGLGLADPENPMADWVSLCDERCMAPGWADSISTPASDQPSRNLPVDTDTATWDTTFFKTSSKTFGESRLTNWPTA